MYNTAIEVICVCMLGIKYNKARVRISVSSAVFYIVVCHFTVIAVADMHVSFCSQTSHV